MTINRVEIDYHPVFNNELTIDFCSGVNVLIGGNGTGKTTLIKKMYGMAKSGQHYRSLDLSNDNNNPLRIDDSTIIVTLTKNLHIVYIPEKDILEHAKGLLTFIEQKQTGFDQVYRDVLIAAQDVPTQEQSEIQKSVVRKTASIINGDVHWDKDEGEFYTLKNDGNRIPFANEASGYKKFGFLGLLVSSGQLESGTVLFWDEPENSLNPELIPILVDILLELSRGGVQIFIATHSEIFASYFAVNRQNGDQVIFASLYKDGEQIKANTSDRFDFLEPNNLTAGPVKLYEKEIEKGLGGNG